MRGSSPPDYLESLKQFMYPTNGADLGVTTIDRNGLNNHKEASDLTEAVKQTLYEDYLQAYSESNR
jgi:hypothetical protein